MTKKRFRLGSPFNGFVDVYDGEVVVASVRVVYAKHLLDLLNTLVEENKQLRQINHNLGDFRSFITEQNVSNEKQKKELQLQLLRLYNYFENYFEDTMNPNAFSEMWDNIKEDEKWEKR